jgi:hypothetical protein
MRSLVSKTFSTDQGQDRKGHIYLILAFVQPIVHNMAPGWGQTVLTSLTLLILAFISYRTVGNIPPEEAEVVREKVREYQEMSPEDLVAESRELAND